MSRKKRITKRPSRRKPTAAAAADSNGEVLDGTLTFQIRGGPHDGKQIEMDAMLLKLACEQQEAAHKLPVDDDGCRRATPEFAVSLNQALIDLGYDCTPTIAVRAWVAVNEYFAAQQKKTS